MVATNHFMIGHEASSTSCYEPGQKPMARKVINSTRKPTSVLQDGHVITLSLKYLCLKLRLLSTLVREATIFAVGSG